MPEPEVESETEYVEEVEYEDVEEEVEVEVEEEEADEAGDATETAAGASAALVEQPETAPLVAEALVAEPAAAAAAADPSLSAPSEALQDAVKADAASSPAPQASPTAGGEPQSEAPAPAPAPPPGQLIAEVGPAVAAAPAVDAAMPAGSTTSQPPKATASEYDLKHLEAHAAKVAKDVQAAAAGVQQKFSAGLQSMLGGVGGPSGASASISKVAGGLSSWWSSLDPIPAPKRDETAERIQSSNKASSELQDVFGLSGDENLVELFKCKLLQTYGCSHNSFTPAIQMAFQGTLYITDKHTCFSVEERGRKLPFKISHADTTKATRQRPARRGDLSDILRLETSAGVWLAFKDFDSGGALDSALALVEHLMEG